MSFPKADTRCDDFAVTPWEARVLKVQNKGISDRLVQNSRNECTPERGEHVEESNVTEAHRNLAEVLMQLAENVSPDVRGNIPEDAGSKDTPIDVDTLETTLLYVFENTPEEPVHTFQGNPLTVTIVFREDGGEVRVEGERYGDKIVLDSGVGVQMIAKRALKDRVEERPQKIFLAGDDD